MSNDSTITASAGRPYGHVPGHSFLDVEITAERCGSRWIATLSITAGNAQESHGRNDQLHREVEYSRTGYTAEEAIESVRDEALDDEEGEVVGYIETAASRALREACEDCDQAAE